MKLRMLGQMVGLAAGAMVLVFGFQNCSLDSPGAETPRSSSQSSVDTQSADIVFQSVPADSTFYVGGAGTLTVVVSSTGNFPLSYKWYKDGVELVGQTSSVLSIPTVALNDAGVYKLVASNSTGKNWININVFVSSNPVITFSQQPSPITVQGGQNGSLSALAVSSDSQSLSYQWFKDNVALVGYTTPTLNITGATVGDAGMYYVEVSSTVGPAQKVKSNTVKVTVQATINVLAANGCVNGYCACVTGGQLGVPHAPSAEAICVFKGFTSLVSFTTSAGVVGAPHCSANGGSCFINANRGNIICANVTCSR